MRVREFILCITAAVGAGYCLHQPAVQEQGYDQAEVQVVNQLAVTRVNLLQRQANAYRDIYGLTAEAASGMNLGLATVSGLSDLLGFYKRHLQ